MFEEFKLPGTNLPHLDWKTRTFRSKEKVQLLLEFLADYERFISNSNTMNLLDVSEPVARKLLGKLCEQKLLVRDTVMLNGHPTHLYGITAAGIRTACAVTNPPTFQPGRCKSAFVTHYLETQRIRIILQQLNSKHEVLNEAAIQRMGIPLKHLPDLLLKAGHGLKLYSDQTWAIEIELTPKSSSRMLQIVQRHLNVVDMEDGAYDRILYLVPRHQFSGFRTLLYHALRSAKTPQILCNDNYDQQMEERPKRFWIAAIDSFESPTSVHVVAENVGKVSECHVLWSDWPEAQ